VGEGGDGQGLPDAMKVTTAPRRERSTEAIALFQQGRTLYQSGDLAAAARVFGRCANRGDARCQVQYGWHCEEGKGVPKIVRRMATWAHNRLYFLYRYDLRFRRQM